MSDRGDQNRTPENAARGVGHLEWSGAMGFRGEIRAGLILESS